MDETAELGRGHHSGKEGFMVYSAELELHPESDITVVLRKDWLPFGEGTGARQE